MKSQLQHRRSKGVTLVELLVVLSIISILTSLVVLGLGGSRAAKLSADGTAVADLAGLAGQNAMAKNMVTALVYAQTVSGKQGFALFQLNSGTWEQVTAWKFLADGVTVDSTQSTFLTPPNPAPQSFPTVSTIAGVAVQNSYYQIFLPSSQIMGASLPSIRLVENSKAANFYDILINPATGRAIVERP